MGFVAHTFEPTFAKHLSLGTWRQPLDDSFWTNGASTFIWDKFVQEQEGSCYSIDIDAQVQAQVREQLSERSTLICGDSVTELWKLTQSVECIDLLYLDSMDLCWVEPEPSSLHHIKELGVAMRALHPGSLVLIDDSPQSETWLPPWVAVWNLEGWSDLSPLKRLSRLCRTVQEEALARVVPETVTPAVVQLYGIFKQSAAIVESKDEASANELAKELQDAFIRSTQWSYLIQSARKSLTTTSSSTRSINHRMKCLAL